MKSLHTTDEGLINFNQKNSFELLAQMNYKQFKILQLHTLVQNLWQIFSLYKKLQSNFSRGHCPTDIIFEEFWDRCWAFGPLPPFVTISTLDPERQNAVSHKHPNTGICCTVCTPEFLPSKVHLITIFMAKMDCHI